MAIESLFPLDLLMDACILAGVQLALDRPCLRRLMRALLAMLCMSALCILMPVNALVRLAAYPLSAFLLLGRRRLPIIIEASLTIFSAYAACAGFMLLCGKQLPVVLICLAVFSHLMFRRRHIRSQWNIEVLLEHNGSTCRFTALIDTGNRLKEHMSGMPILIAEERILTKTIAGLDPDACVRLPYGVLGASGEILCFRPDMLLIRTDGGKLIPAPECLVGIFPLKIPGSTRALAPPEFAQCISQAAFPHILINQFCRRYFHGIFKHKAIHLWSGGSDSQGLGLLHRRQ